MLRPLVIFILLGLSTAILQSIRRPFELVLAVNEDKTCSVVSIRQTQHHKGLSDQPGHYVIERPRKLAAHLDEEIHVFAFDQEVFRELGSTGRIQARLACNGIAWGKYIPFGPAWISAASRQTVVSKIPVDSVDWDHRPPSLHIERLIESGPSNNRIDLVFFGDGCTYIIKCAFMSCSLKSCWFKYHIFMRETDTSDEYDKFMADATRLSEDISNNQTFNTVKPLLNFWAAFSPSNEVSTSALYATMPKTARCRAA
jgi:hypothetical protein